MTSRSRLLSTMRTIGVGGAWSAGGTDERAWMHIALGHDAGEGCGDAQVPFDRRVIELSA